MSGEVVGLGDVGVEVEEEGLGLGVGILFVLAAFFEKELPFPLADSLEIAPGGVVDEFVAGGFVATEDQRGDIKTVDLAVFGKCGLGELGDGGKEVDGSGDGIAFGARRNPPRGPT